MRRLVQRMQIIKGCMNEVTLLEIGSSDDPELYEIAINSTFIRLVKGYGYFDDDDFIVLPHSYCT